jgi:hypothetical protein
VNATFYAIDFDRTLGNVERHVARLNHFLEDRGLLAPGELTTQVNEARAAGESFDVLGYVQATHPDMTLRFLQSDYLAYVAGHHNELLMPGAVEVIHWLQTTKRAFGIVSYGNKDWQEFKIKAAGLDTFLCLIVPTREKATLIATWKHDDTFVIPMKLEGNQSYETVVLIDDHITAFNELPRGMRGYWVTDASTEPPAGVTKITSLEKVIEYEATR